MKKIFRFTLAAVIISLAAVSCKNDDPADEGNAPEYTPTEVEKEAGPTGVSLKATDITTGDFQLITEMGADILSYRIDVMPKAKFINDYYETLKTQPTLTETDYAAYRLTQGNGNGGYVLKNPLDTKWSESIYVQAEMIHTLDYVVLTVGCEDESGTVTQEVNILDVPLKRANVKGDPRATPTLLSDYQAFEVSYTMNKDCAGYYQLTTPTDHVNQTKAYFAERFGNQAEKMFRDLICCYDIAKYTENMDGRVIDFKFAASPEAYITALSVGLDSNFTPNLSYDSVTEHIKKQNEDLPDAEYTLKVAYTSACTAQLDIQAKWDVTKWVTCREVNDATLKDLLEDYTEEEIAMQIADDGWHIGPNHTPEFICAVSPNTHYTVLSTGQNKEIRLLPLRKTEMTTKPLIENERDQSKAKITTTISEVGRTTAKISNSRSEETTLLFERVLEQGAQNEAGIDITDPINGQALWDFLVHGDGANLVFRDQSAEWTWTGLEPDKHYFHCIIGEDIDGRLSNLKITEFDTKSAKGGPNPKVELVGETTKQADGSYLWTVYFNLNEDVSSIRYCITENKFVDEEMTEEEKINAWTDEVIGDAGMNTRNSTRLEIPVTKYSQNIALCVPFGEQNKQAALEVLMFDPATLQSSMLRKVRPFKLAEPAATAKIRPVQM